MARVVRHLFRTAAWLILFAVCTLPLSAGSARQVPRQAPKVDAVLIHKTEYLCGDEAVLVTKPQRVKELAALVLDNETVGHACGFHWLIRFAMPDGTLTTRAHNIECEEYLRSDAEAHALLNRYFQQALKKPQSFIIDLTVRATVSPEELSAALVKVGRIFLFDGAEARLPKLTVRATADRAIPEDRGQWRAASSAKEAAAGALLASAVAAVTQKQPAASLGPVEHPGGEFGGGKIVDHLQRTVYLAFGSSLTSISALLRGTTVVEVERPEEYTAQLVTSKWLDVSARAALLAEHPFLLAAAPFHNGCVPVR